MDWVREESDGNGYIEEHQQVRDHNDRGVLRTFKLYIIFDRSLSKIVSLDRNSTVTIFSTIRIIVILHDII